MIHCKAEADRNTRVKVYTMDGTQIGLPGVGEGDNRLTFPRRFLVGDALRARDWIRFATPEERAATQQGVFSSGGVHSQIGHQ